MIARTLTATALAFRDQRRRPLLLVLILFIPVYIVTRSAAETQAAPRLIELAGNVWVNTTMKALHPPEMAKITIAFVAAIVGVFVMQSALLGDKRLVAAGYRPGETVLSRLAVLLAAIGLVVAVSAVVTAWFLSPVNWVPVIAGFVLAGLMYGAIGALAGALMDKLAATYFILFVAMTDLGVVQTPMFHSSPVWYAPLLPGYGPTRVMFDGALGQNFNAWPELALSLGWVAILAFAVWLFLRRAVAAHG